MGITLSFSAYHLNMSIFAKLVPPLFRLESGKLLGGTNFANMDMFKWYALNDNVMGGVSNGNVTKNDANNLSFWGKLSSENRGGFASCRTEIETGLLDGFSGLSF